MKPIIYYLSCIGFILSVFMAFKFGTRCTLDKVKLKGQYADRVMHASFWTTKDNCAVSVFYPGAKKPPVGAARKRWLDYENEDHAMLFLKGFATARKWFGKPTSMASLLPYSHVVTPVFKSDQSGKK